MRNFDRDGDASRHDISELLESSPKDFGDAAVEILRHPDDTRAFQHVVAILVSQGLLTPILCNPALTRDQVLAAARAAQRVDPMADAAIAKSLADGVISYDRAVRPKDAARLLEVLSEISDGSRILPSLMRLLRHPNSQLRSKAVKMIGRGSRSAKWVRGRLADSDPRVRANAIESLWGVATEEVRELLLASVHDGNNRVVGNALLALHRIGEASVIGDFYRLAADESSRFRATAAWAMGESGDPRFSEALAHLLRDPHPAVRARALAGLGRIKTALSKPRQMAPWRVAGILLDNPQSGLRRLQLAVAPEDSAEYPAVLATQFLVVEDGQPVTTYRFATRPEPEAMSVSFVFPRSSSPVEDCAVRGALRCRPWKRTSDLWGVQPYIPAGESGAADRPADEPSRLTPDWDTIEAALTEPPKRAQCGGFWDAVLQSLQPDFGGSRGKSHVIAFNRSVSLEAPSEEYVSGVAAGTLVQVISTVACPPLEDWCRRVRGLFVRAESEESAAGAIASAYLSLLARYEIAYTPVRADCGAVKVRVQTAVGWGEANILNPNQGQNQNL